jgi:hypothetical protein
MSEENRLQRENLVCLVRLITAVTQSQRTPTPSLAEIESHDRTDKSTRARKREGREIQMLKSRKIGVDQVHLASSARMKYALATS